jgi:hypothetical protein
VTVLTKIWRRLRGPGTDEEARADEEAVRRELQLSAPAPELAKLAAARGAKLVRARGAFIGAKKEMDVPGTLMPDLELIGVTLEFAGRSPLSLKGHGHGEGLTPCAAEDIVWEGVETRDLNELEPFADVVGTRLRELTLLSHRHHPHHVGIRLQFERAELVFLNLWDEIETYSGLVPEVLQPQNEPGHVYEHVYEYPYDGKS